jgi:hypothetical protein
MNRFGLAALAAALVLLGACSSSSGGSPEGDTVALPTTPVSSPAAASTTPPSKHSASAPVVVTSAPPVIESSAPAPSTAAPVIHPAPSTPLRTVTVAGYSGVTYVIKIWAEQKPTDCAAHAYGEVAAYLTKYPCAGGLDQVLATTTIGGKAVGFEQNSVGFGGSSQTDIYKTAGGFHTLVQKDGTGNINDLLREGYRLPSGPTSVPSPDAVDAESQDNGVTIVDAWYLSGKTPENAKPLVTMAKDIFLQY